MDASARSARILRYSRVMRSERVCSSAVGVEREVGLDAFEQGPVLALHVTVDVDDPPLAFVVGVVVAGDELAEQRVLVVDRRRRLVQHVGQPVGVLERAAEHERLDQLGMGDPGDEVLGDAGVALLLLGTREMYETVNRRRVPVALDVEVGEPRVGVGPDRGTMDEGQVADVEGVVDAARRRRRPLLDQLVDERVARVLELGQHGDPLCRHADAHPHQAVALVGEDRRRGGRAAGSAGRAARRGSRRNGRRRRSAIRGTGRRDSRPDIQPIDRRAARCGHRSLAARTVPAPSRHVTQLSAKRRNGRGLSSSSSA